MCAAMRIQLSEDIYDYLVNCEPKFVITNRGLRLVLVSNLHIYTVTGYCLRTISDT